MKRSRNSISPTVSGVSTGGAASAGSGTPHKNTPADKTSRKPDALRQRVEKLTIDGIPWIALVGRNSFLRSYSPTKLHSHKGCIEIIYCQHGTCEYESKGRTFHLWPGRVFVSRPNESHRMLSNPKGLMTCYMLFKIPEKNATGPFVDEFRFIADKLRRMPRLFDGGHRTGSCFVRLFNLAGRSFDDPCERQLRVVSFCFSLILSLLDAADRPMPQGMSGRIFELAETMRSHPEEEYPIAMLAERIGYSPTSLLNGFKAATGYTPHAFLVKCRIERAKELLDCGAKNVTAVAEELGFPSPQHFATQFRNATGLTPSGWRTRKRT